MNRTRAFLAALLLATPTLAQEKPMLQPADYASAAIRNSAVPGGYEVRAVPELGAVFAASVPDFKDGAPGDVYMLRADDLSVMRRIQLQRRPFALAMDHKRGWLYAGNTKDGSLTVIDAKSGLVLRTVQLGQPGKGGKMEHTRMIEVDQDTGRVFVTGPTDEGIVWIVNGVANKVLHRLDDVGIWAAGLAYDGKGRLYVGAGGAHEIIVLDAATGAQLTRFSTGDTPEGAGNDSAHFFVNLSLDVAGKRLFAVDSHSGQLYVFDTDSGRELARLPIGKGALDVEYNPTRNEAYVTYYGIDQQDPVGWGGLVVIDAESMTERQRLNIPTFPSNLSLDDSGATLFMSVSEPSRPEHPDYRPNAMGSVLRLDLKSLKALH